MDPLTGNIDADRLILEKLDNYDLLKVCKISNKYISKLCDENLFRRRVNLNFPRLIKPENLTWKKYYIYLIYWSSLLNEKYNFISNDLRGDPKKYFEILKRYDISKEILNKCNFKQTFGVHVDLKGGENDGMIRAANLGYLDLVKYFIDLGANNFNIGLVDSAENSQREIFDFFVTQGANDFETAYDFGSENMCEYIKNNFLKR